MSKTHGIGIKKVYKLTTNLPLKVELDRVKSTQITPVTPS